MVSDIDQDLAELGKAPKPQPIPQPAPRPAAPAIPPTVSAPRPQPSPPKAAAPVFTAPPKKPAGSGKIWGWVIGIGVVIWLANSGSNSSKTSPTPSYSPPQSTATYRPSAPAPAAPVYVPPPAFEERPPIGNGLNFNDAQIRYCLAEDIRIKAMQGVVDHYSESSVDGFNQYVQDFNARCSHFRYRRGALESARSEVESRQATLHAEGLKRAFANR